MPVKMMAVLDNRIRRLYLIVNVCENYLFFTNKWHVKVGGANEMIEHYKEMLVQLEEEEPRNEELIALRHEHIARIL